MSKHPVGRRVMLYWPWVREEAALIHADGCTGVSNIQGNCCLQHDLEFYYGRSATDAYRRYVNGEINPWGLAEPVTFADANDHFKRCHFRHSKLGYLNLLGWCRYGAMRLRKTRAAWDQHRQDRPVEAV